MELLEGDRLRVKVDAYVAGALTLPRGTVVVVTEVVEGRPVFAAETERRTRDDTSYRLLCRHEDVGTSLEFLSRGSYAG